MASDSAPLPSSASSKLPLALRWEAVTASAGLLLVVSATVVAGLLRLHLLAARPFRLDETFSAIIARLPWSEFVLVLANREANMSFYYFILRGWMALGTSEAFVRGLSVVFSVAAIPFLYALGARLFGRRAGWLAAWLLALNAFHIRYAQEARSYALVVLLATLSSWLLVRNVQQPSSARWGLYAALMALALYSHFYCALLLVAHLASLLCLPRERVPWRNLARSMAWFTAAVAPLALFVLRAGNGPINWIAPVDRTAVLGFLNVMTGNGGAAAMLLAGVALGLAGIAGCRAWYANRARHDAWPYTFVLAWLVLPAGIVFSVSAFLPVFHQRFLILSLPALALAIAAGIAQLRSRACSTVLFAALAVSMMAGTLSYYRAGLAEEPHADWRGASSYVLDHARSGDGVFFFLSLGRIPFEYQRWRRGPGVAPVQPLYGSPTPELSYRDFLFAPLADVLRDARPAPDRVWIVSSHDWMPDGTPNRAAVMARAWYAQGRKLAEEKQFEGISVRLYARDPAEEASASGASPAAQRRR